jgi:hypothetical protein
MSIRAKIIEILLYKYTAAENETIGSTTHFICIEKSSEVVTMVFKASLFKHFL